MISSNFNDFVVTFCCFFTVWLDQFNVFHAVSNMASKFFLSFFLPFLRPLTKRILQDGRSYRGGNLCDLRTVDLASDSNGSFFLLELTLELT